MSDQKVTTNSEMLIRLDERMVVVLEELKEIKTNQSMQMAKFETRLISLETFRQTQAADAKLKEWDEAAAWVKDFKKTWVMITSLVGLIAGVVGYFMNNIVAWLQSRGG